MFRRDAPWRPYRRDRSYRPLLVANGTPDTPSGAPLQSDAADRIKANWEPLRTGQRVPMVGEDVTPDADPLCDR